jgi:RimJ/RimL family protein N-acetyltransferase
VNQHTSEAGATPGKLALPTLEAERVTLRPLRADDVHALFGLFSDPKVARFWSRPAMTHLSQARSARPRATDSGRRATRRIGHMR